MKYVFIFLLGGALAACNMNDKTTSVQGVTGDQHANHVDDSPKTIDSANLTTVEWLDPVEQNLGSITKGQVVEVSWKFKNTGSKPLTIESVQAGCGCTTPEPPKEPIAPGAEGVIKAKFNSENFSGHVTKDVTVQANNSNRNNGLNNRLTFTADIKE